MFAEPISPSALMTFKRSGKFVELFVITLRRNGNADFPMYPMAEMAYAAVARLVPCASCVRLGTASDAVEPRTENAKTTASARGGDFSVRIDRKGVISTAVRSHVSQANWNF